MYSERKFLENLNTILSAGVGENDLSSSWLVPNGRAYESA